MRKPNVFNVPIKTRITPAIPDDANEGAKYTAYATVVITPYGTFEARSSGKTRHSARKFAQAFALHAVAEALLNQAEHLEERQVQKNLDSIRAFNAGAANV